MDRTGKIREILAQATKSAYDQGWADAMQAFERAAGAPLPSRDVQKELDLPKWDDPRPIQSGTKATEAVLFLIRKFPDQSGADIARMLPDIPERTVRTALRRLRLNGRIGHAETGGWVAL